MLLGRVLEVCLILVYERGARVNRPFNQIVPRRLTMQLLHVGKGADRRGEDLILREAPIFVHVCFAQLLEVLVRVVHGAWCFREALLH